MGRSAAHSIFCNSAICVWPGPDRDRLGARRVCNGRHFGQHVLGQRDHDGTRPPLHGGVKCTLDNFGNLLGSLDLRRELCGRAEKRAIVHFLERAAPQHARSTWPMNRIIGAESCSAMCIPCAALVAPGPRVTKQIPGRPVSRPSASAMIAAPASCRQMVSSIGARSWRQGRRGRIRQERNRRAQPPARRVGR